jgi:hypothetical protein
MAEQNSERLATKVTVGVGAGIPRVFKGVRVELNYERALVEIWSAEGTTHLATAPLSASLIEWEVVPPTRHKITAEKQNGRAVKEVVLSVH